MTYTDLNDKELELIMDALDYYFQYNLKMMDSTGKHVKEDKITILTSILNKLK